MYVGFYTLLGYLFFYVQRNLGGDVKTTTGIVLLVFTLAGAIGALAAARPARTTDRRALASAGGAGFVMALFAFLLSHSLLAVIASASIAGAAWGIFLTADWALGCQFLPRFALATAMGVWNLALLLPQIAAPLAATAVLTALHALQSAEAPNIAFVLAAMEVTMGIAWICACRLTHGLSVNARRCGNRNLGSRAWAPTECALARHTKF